jgi:hypothetical protein
MEHLQTAKRRLQHRVELHKSGDFTSRCWKGDPWKIYPGYQQPKQEKAGIIHSGQVAIPLFG